MKKVKILWRTIIMGGILVFGSTACVYETIVPEVIEPIVEDVSFNDEIIPIFDADCNGAGCHNSSGWSPNLSPAGAYNALTSGGFVDTSDPSNSRLYKKVAPGGSMEGFSTPQNTALILAWITQGAQNN